MHPTASALTMGPPTQPSTFMLKGCRKKANAPRSQQISHAPAAHCAAAAAPCIGRGQASGAARRQTETPLQPAKLTRDSTPAPTTAAGRACSSRDTRMSEAELPPAAAAHEAAPSGGDAGGGILAACRRPPANGPKQSVDVLPTRHDVRGGPPPARVTAGLVVRDGGRILDLARLCIVL